MVAPLPGRNLIGENEFTGVLDIYEIKMDAKRLEPAKLSAKGKAFLEKHPEYRQHAISFKCLSLKDM